MATRKPRPNLPAELHQYNHTLDAALRHFFGMSVRSFKIIKAVTQLIGVVAGVYAMTLGADPTTALLIIAFIYAGPEVAEHVLVESVSNITEDSDRE
jgi:predicted branched-subunit amino acid permease